MTKALGTVVKLLVGSLLGLIAILLLLFALALTNDPAPKNPVQVDAKATAMAKSLVYRFSDAINSEQRPQFFFFHETQINGVFALGHRASERFDGYSEIRMDGIHVTLRHRLLDTPHGKYLGIDFVIPPSSQGLQIQQLKVGRISIPGNWVLNCGEWLGNLILGDQVATELRNSIKEVQIKPFKARLVMDTPMNMEDRLSYISNRIKGLTGDLNLFSDTELTKAYFLDLLEIEKQFPRNSRVPLEAILKPLFAKVHAQSSLINASDHNRSALLALGVYLGTYHFEKLIGPIAPEGYQGHLIPIRVTLSKRDDLRLHFIYSATLKLLSDRGASFAIGEFKELLDSNTGGSGFSFVDLTADRAGILFAERATANNLAARAFQQQVIDSVEQGLLPDLGKLKEGLSEQDFESLYKNVDSEEYQGQVQWIDQHLQQRPVFNTP